MPRRTTPSAPSSLKMDPKIVSTITRLEKKLLSLEGTVKKLQSQVTVFKKNAIERRDRQTESQLRKKLGQT